MSILANPFTFQFHKGAIRTNYANSAGSANSDFNSIKVRLERTYLTRPRTLYTYFNSIKVRLELFTVQFGEREIL